MKNIDKTSKRMKVGGIIENTWITNNIELIYQLILIINLLPTFYNRKATLETKQFDKIVVRN